MASCERFMAIPELHEQMLLHLPLSDLLLAERVSKSWQAAIRGSPSIRQALFRESFPIKGEQENTLTYDAEVNKWRTASGKHLQLLPVYNPFMHHYLHASHSRKSTTYFNHYRFVEPMALALNKYDRENAKAWNRPRASWKPALIMQPATSTLGIICGERTSEQLAPTRVQDDEGVKLGEFVRMMRLHWIECVGCPFGYAHANTPEDPYVVGGEWLVRDRSEVDEMPLHIETTGWEMLGQLEQRGKVASPAAEKE